jgi:magnesium-transporting ATPase (P-type)
VVLGTGDVVPADLRLFEAKDFKVSEMALTGTTWAHTAGQMCSAEVWVASTI